MQLRPWCALASIVLTTMLAAQSTYLPQPTPMPPAIAGPVDTPYPGTIQLHVDATNAGLHYVQVSEEVPVKPGPLTLLYPEWIPGDHAPSGPISKLAGLTVQANGSPLPWLRDSVNMYAFHIQVPTGAKSITVSFQYLDAVRRGDGHIGMSDELLDLAWNTVVLYPAGHFSRRITFEPTLKINKGWKYATALDTASQDGDTIHFKPVTLNNLVDSPVYAGLYYNRVDLSTAPDNQVFLNVFGDEAKDVKMSPELIQLHKNLAVQAQKLYASHHYDKYNFLFSLSDKVSGNGLEHHQSSEDGTSADYFTSWPTTVAERDLLAHEYTHSWNGKFRRPADLWTPNFNVPMRDDLLWVYEGMTQYWGNILTARAGMRTPEEARGLLASTAAGFEAARGREWRPLVDTTNQETMSHRGPVSWVSWQRAEDYYTEGMLIWLDADTLIRQKSNNAKSLDDFCKLFFGIDNGSYITHTYTLQDVVDALNKVQPYDWKTFLEERVYKLHPQVPENGFTQGGYKLVYSDTEPAWMKSRGARSRARGSSYNTSLGITVTADGNIGSMTWEGVAYKQGILPGMQIIAVNGTAFTSDVLKAAIVAAEKSSDPIHLLVKNGTAVKNLDINYHDGLRYPNLERLPNTPAYLDDILAPVK